MTLAAVTLDDKYVQESGRIYLSGIQALVRLPLMQRQRDQAAGLNTGGFISGYRGSPLGVYDNALWQARRFLERANVYFQPGINEDLAATSVWGSQQTTLFPGAKVDGVFGIWYGKGPGVDRSIDALKHANAAGTAPHGGVLAIAGDDHGCQSSTLAHQSEQDFISAMIPVLNPATVQEYLDYGLLGFALSRYSGCWIGFKAVAEAVESSASVAVDPLRLEIVTPRDFEMPPGGLNIRWPDPPLDQERRLHGPKMEAVAAFVRANAIDRIIWDSPVPRLGIISTGKAYLDLRQALDDLGIGERDAARLGLRLYKVGLTWPLEVEGARRFADGLKDVLVVEEKRGLIEDQLLKLLYHMDAARRPSVVGKRDEQGRVLLPSEGEITPTMVARALVERLRRLDGDNPQLNQRMARLEGLQRIGDAPAAKTQRTPFFCSGCPHNTSTKLPEGSRAGAGIGCHAMTIWMPARRTTTWTHMGGEGANWIGQAPFTREKHVFQNLGDGTYTHSGLLAIRAAAAAGVNITYKILFNDAVAMTGGQPVDGPISVRAIAHEVRANGVVRIAVITDDPGKFDMRDFPHGTTLHGREHLDAVQRELRELPGVSVLIYEQECATERRRRRKRGQAADPPKFAFINDLVCEGCGDCSVESNCLSVEPKETPFGRKRQINLSTCNKDFSCVNGFCPSFVTLDGARRRKKNGMAGDALARVGSLPAPNLPALDRPYNLLITGVGGTGVITLGALVTMAAHLEGKGASVLDFTGFAQKFGPVLSFIRIASTPEEIHQVRIDQGAADALIGCDVVVSSSAKASTTYGPTMRAVLNTAEMPTGDVVRNREADLSVSARSQQLERLVGKDNLLSFDANRAASLLFGDTVFANMIMLGAAWQRGLVPVTLDALMRAIELNGVAVEANKRAFASGRLAATDPAFIAGPGSSLPQAETLEDIVARRADYLRDYQDDDYAARYLSRVNKVRDIERSRSPGSERIATAVAKSLFKLMAYKDEYEVARLHLSSEFREKLREEFEDGFTINYHFAPPLVPSGHDARGRPLKRRFGPWVTPLLSLLTRLKFLRGTPLDPFGRTADRRMERGLIGWYEQLLDELLPHLGPDTSDNIADIAAQPMEIRGFGPIKEAAVAEVKAKVETLSAAVRG
ncbi:MAG TPA: indolepyruvate ferredoxin oxidoreductase family protein [Bradyrhizobium sp.]|uniref:indolepyruvate ferredoxin oxidoreductase family protein n=1 Tax=Bradyrhizobium sp. TaxID=376 RepID=UPI002C0EED76|nr:indolepyruvate ferredoxin oxidoreductase family protein [Bradyrhizobium sp.]HLZ05578.1 indolepyruvate ferredoxin oxidoreductase family protein [Bradyrhizobium sp.]